jgi:hypothetical protein
LLGGGSLPAEQAQVEKEDSGLHVVQAEPTADAQTALVVHEAGQERSRAIEQRLLRAIRSDELLLSGSPKRPADDLLPADRLHVVHEDETPDRVAPPLRPKPRPFRLASAVRFRDQPQGAQNSLEVPDGRLGRGFSGEVGE